MSKPVFDQPYGLRYKVDGVQMQLSWRPDFGAEKTAALQKAQYAMAQEAAGSSTVMFRWTPAH